jgi:hypothetical protein
MAVLTNFPLDYDDQISVIEIFDGLMRQLDDPVNSTQGTPRKPNSSLPDLPDAGLQRISPDPSE